MARAICGMACKVFAIVMLTTGLASVAWAGGGLPTDVPEIDPGSVGSAVAVVLGGMALLADRYRTKTR